MKKDQKLQMRVFTILVIILAIILLCYFLFYIVTNATEIYKQYGNFTWQFFYEILFLILKTLGKIIFNPFTFIFGFPFLITFICVKLFNAKLFNKEIRRTKLSSIDINDYNGYFRDILEKYSVSVLSYIDNFKLHYPSVLIAMLLQMEHKKIIAFNEDYITVNWYNGELKPSEKVILDNIRNGKLNWSYFTSSLIIEQFEDNIKEESLACSLLEEKENSYQSLIKKVFFFTILTVIGFCLACILSVMEPSLEKYFVIIAEILVFISIIEFLFLFTLYLVNRDINYFRTKKGEEINKKLEGLKNYLKDFSNLSERNKEDIVLWDEYLIYSVLFNQNTEIIDKYKNLIVYV